LGTINNGIRLTGAAGDHRHQADRPIPALLGDAEVSENARHAHNSLVQERPE